MADLIAREYKQFEDIKHTDEIGREQLKKLKEKKEVLMLDE